MFEFFAFNTDSSARFTMELNNRSKDGWEIQKSGYVGLEKYPYEKWWVIMQRPTGLGD